jgi:hypothetical protein
MRQLSRGNRRTIADGVIRAGLVARRIDLQSLEEDRLLEIVLEDVEKDYLLELVIDPAELSQSQWIAIAALVQRPVASATRYLVYEDTPSASFIYGGNATQELNAPGMREVIYLRREGLAPFVQQALKSPDKRSQAKVFLEASYGAGEPIKPTIIIDIRVEKKKPDRPVVTWITVDSSKDVSDRYCVLQTMSIALDTEFDYRSTLRLELICEEKGPALLFVDAGADALKSEFCISAADIQASNATLTADVGISWLAMEQALSVPASSIKATLRIGCCSDPLGQLPFAFEDIAVEFGFKPRKKPDRVIFQIGRSQRACLLEGKSPSVNFDEVLVRLENGPTLNGATSMRIDYGGNKTPYGANKYKLILTTSQGPREYERPFKIGQLIEFSDWAKAVGNGFDSWADVTAIEISGKLKLKEGTEDEVKSNPQWNVKIPCSFVTPPPRYLYCIDFGTSATSIGISRIDHDGETFVSLPLGKWLEEIDHLHDESKVFDDASSGELIPSHIGLSSELNQRSRFDPLSLGDLSRVGSDRIATGARLAALDLSYDVSIPASSFAATTLFSGADGADGPPSSEARNYVESAVWNLKTTLLRPGRQAEASGDIWRRLPTGQLDPVRSADAQILLRDYMRELGRYVVLRSVEFAKRDANPSENMSIAFEALDASDDDIGVVLSHPSGLSPARIEAYRSAGAAFLASVSGKPVDGSLRRRVFLVPEAIAAAAMARSERISETKKEIIAALDIGAGTYDVAVISEPEQETADHWTVHADFAFHVAGRVLDRKLAKLVTRVLRSAARQDEIRQRVDIQDNLPESVVDIPRYGSDLDRARGAEFLRAIRRAKSQLTAAARSQSGPYRWPDNEPFKLLLGNPAAGARAPVRQKPRSGSGAIVLPISNAYARLEVGTNEIYLLIEKALLSGPVSSLDSEVAEAGREYLDVLNLLGTEIPKLVTEELKEILETLESSPAVRWQVTGRTSLWPPLYAAIYKQVSQLGDDALMQRSMSPSTMKRSVVEGAARLVRLGRHHALRRSPSYAAVLAESIASRNGVEKIGYLLAEDFETAQLLPYAAEEGARLVDAIPGLDKENDVLGLLSRITSRLPASESIAPPFAPLETISPGKKTELRLENDASNTRYEIRRGNLFTQGSFRGFCR